jgi:O-antigen ligase
MTPYIALFITIIFIYLVFKIDFKNESKISYALWIPLIWMMRSASKPFSFWIDPKTPGSTPEMDIVEGDPFERAIFIILITLTLIVLLRRKIEWKNLIKNNIWIFTWYFYCAISVLWSDFPIVLVKRYIKEIGFFLGVLIVLTEKDPKVAVNTVLKKFSYILIPISIILIIYFPSLGMSYSIDTGFISYAGVAHNKNGLGAICLVSALIFFYNIVSRRQMSQVSIFNKQKIIYWLYGIVSFILLIKINSSTALGALIIGIVFIIGMRIKIVKENIKILGIYIFGVLIAGIILQYTFDIKELFLSSLGRESTLTGRTLLWKDLLNMQNHPLIGVGYSSFWLGKRLAILWETQPWRPMQSHNGYLNVYLELGGIGLSLMVIIFCASYKKIKNELIKNYDYAIFQFGIIIITLLYNVTESSFGSISIMWFICLLALVDTSKYSQNMVLTKEIESKYVRRRDYRNYEDDF